MLTLRPARSADAAYLAEIGLKAWEKAINAWGENAESLRENAARAYSDFCALQWPDILVGEWEGEPVGWGACENAEDLVSDLWVLPDFQRRGIGTALLIELEKGIAARGYHHARIETHARNAGAIRLYKELGYQVRAYAVSYSAPLDRDIDKVELVKPFDRVDEVRAFFEADDGLYSATGD